VFFNHARETVDFHYERKLFDIGGKLRADPRVSHALTLEVDSYGNTIKAASIGYGRRFDAPDLEFLPQDRDNQRLIHITYTESGVTNAIDDVNKYPDDYRTPLPAETQTYEVRKAAQEKSSRALTVLFRFNQTVQRVAQAGDGNHDIDYEDRLFTKAQKAVKCDSGEREKSFRRLIEHVPRGNDYRVLQPALAMDPNRNCSEVRFDALGMVVGTAVMGKPEENPRPGNRFTAAFHVDLTQAEIDQFLADSKGSMAATLLAAATTRAVYDLMAYRREPDSAKKPPAVAATLARETHVSDLPVGQQTRIQASLSYSDGFSREIQKIQAEPGPVPTRDATGKIIVGANGQPVPTQNDVNPRWVGSGWAVFNNKGKPARQYEPFFTDTHRFEFDVRVGVSPVLFYDPAERVIATLHPNHTYEKVVFDPWQQTNYDVNDTLTSDPRTDDDVRGYFTRLPDAEYLPTWYDRMRASADIHERNAAQRTEAHAGTSTVAHFDALGRPFLSIADNGVQGRYETRLELDIEGNQRSVTDARGNVVMRYDYDMLGNGVHQASMDAASAGC
jgi:hypothetical protein